MRRKLEGKSGSVEGRLDNGKSPMAQRHIDILRVPKAPGPADRLQKLQVPAIFSAGKASA
ncbi:MAG: hypothetical protein WBX38_16710 [Candidatus Sulfotelmatobacter sp.]